jgi:ELWxxDGT repeat protein
VELWESNGTAAGTRMVADINPGRVSSYPSQLTNVNVVLFFTANDGNGAHGAELWESNATALGTKMVADISPGPTSSVPSYLTNVNGTLFFIADGVHGEQLWRSSGSAVGTSMLTDIQGGGTGYASTVVPDGVVRQPIPHLVNVNGTLFFRVNDGTHGVELWQSNGTAPGTMMVKDLNPGAAGSYASYLTNANGTLFFSANDGFHGFEPWTFGPLPAPSHALAATETSPAIDPIATPGSLGHAMLLTTTEELPTIGLDATPVPLRAATTTVAASNIGSARDISTNSSPGTSYLDNWVVHLPANDLTFECDALNQGLDWTALTGDPFSRRR